jgi:hypothetical protein
VTDHWQLDVVLVAMQEQADSGLGTWVDLLVHYIESLDSLHEERKEELKNRCERNGKIISPAMATS